MAVTTLPGGTFTRAADPGEGIIRPVPDVGSPWAGRRCRGTVPSRRSCACRISITPNILLIPGTSSVAHLRENITGAGLALSGDDLAELDSIG